MKTKKMIMTWLALISLSLVKPTFGQITITAPFSPPKMNVSVTTNSFSYNQQICETSQFIKVLDVNVENLDTASADSVLIGDIVLGSYANPFTLSDSLFIYENGKEIVKGKFISGNITLTLNKWVMPTKTVNLIIYCKTLNVSGYTGTYIYLNGLYYTKNSSTYSVWPNLQSYWFYTYDCTMPIITDNKSVNRNSTFCLDEFGDTIMMMGFTIKNPNKDSISIDGLRVFGEGKASWLAQIDSFLIYQNGVVLDSKELYSNFSSLYFKKVIPGLSSMDFQLGSKISSFGQLPYIEIDSIFWTLTGKQKASDTWLGSYGGSLQDCKPSISLWTYTNRPINRKNNGVCSSDEVSLYTNLNQYTHKIVKHEYFANGKLFKKFYGFSDEEFKVPLTIPETKVVVRITDTTGRMAIDSVTFNVTQSPTAKISVSSIYMCVGESVTFTADTTGVDLWAWDWEEFSNQTKLERVVWTEGKHNFSVVSGNQCSADTSVYIYKIPAQQKPSITISDWVLGSSVKADSFSWFKYNDSIKEWIVIGNSNQRFINRTDKGFFIVRAFNIGGCFAESDYVAFNGYTAQDSLPHVKLMISASKPGNEFCSSEKLTATRKILETKYSIVKEEWFLNGDKIPFSKNQLFDGMQYLIPTNSQTIKLKVVITDKVGKMAMDSVILKVHENPKLNVSASNTQMCSGDSVIILADTTGLYKWAWGNSKPSNANDVKINVKDGGIYTFTAVSLNGCTSDTSITVTKFPEQSKPSGLSNDWTIGSSVKADSFVWFRLNDTTSKFKEIENSNKMFVREFRKGYYAVEAFNRYGCSSLSDAFHHKGWVIQDSLPHVKLMISASKPGKEFCSDEKIIATRKTFETAFPIVKEEWFLNGVKIPFMKNQMFDGMTYNVPMTTETVKVKVVVTDSVGKMASDSTELTVFKNPKASIVLSADKFCSGENVIITADTTGVSKYAWGNDKPNNSYTNKLNVYESGSYKFTVVSKEGCSNDTTVMVQKFPTPNKPVGLSNDWTIGSSIQADYFVWFRLNDTTNSFRAIENSNKMFLRELRKGYYFVEVFNANDCSNISDVFYHKGYEVKDSLPHVKILFSASKPGIKFCGDEKIVATRKVLETAYPVIKEEWFLNGGKIPFTKNQLFDGMQYLVPLTTGSVKVKVVVTDEIGKQAMDSFEFTVLAKPRINLGHLSTNLCYGTVIELALDTSTGIDKWAWNGVFSKNPINKVVFTETTVQSLIVYSKEGCISDTSIQITMLPMQERLKISSQDTMLWVNQMAYKVIWLYNGYNVIDTDKQIITSKKSGFYQVRAFNEFGCESLSDLFRFDYVALKEPCSIKKPILVYEVFPNYCSDRVVDFTIKQSQDYVSIFWPNQNKTGDTLSVKGPNGIFFAKVTNTNGCISYSDTVEINSIYIPKPSLAISNCELFADIQFDTDKGSYNWIKNNTPIQITSKSAYKVDNDNGFWKVQFEHKSGCVSALSDPVFAQCKTSGTKDQDIQNGLIIYPNPVIDQFTIESSLGKGEAHLTDMQGRVLQTIIVENGINTITRDGLPSGVYIVHFSDGSATKLVFK